MSQVELKPCPFCGACGRIEDIGEGSRAAWLAGCESCNSEPERSLYISMPSRAEAIAAWNTRAPVAPPSDQGEVSEAARAWLDFKTALLAQYAGWPNGGIEAMQTLNRLLGPPKPEALKPNP